MENSNTASLRCLSIEGEGGAPKPIREIAWKAQLRPVPAIASSPARQAGQCRHRGDRPRTGRLCLGHRPARAADSGLIGERVSRSNGGAGEPSDTLLLGKAGGAAAAGPLTKEHGWGQAACELTHHQLLRSVARRRGVQGQTASAPCPRYPTARSFFCRSGQATRSWPRRPPGLAPHDRRRGGEP